MPPLVLFVSKPVVPPYHDGTKCLVRDVALNLRRHRAEIMVTPGVSDLGAPPAEGHPGVRFAEVYSAKGSFTPTFAANARAAAWLVARSRADVWHFAFAPNPRTSAVGRWAKAVRGVPVVQTIASAPRQFTPGLFFGDVVVAQSRWTRDRVVEAFRGAEQAPPRIEVIPPPIGPLRERRPDELAEVRRTLRLPEGVPILVYPGDLEVSQGAETVARAVATLARGLPEAIVVFACRFKTAAAPGVERALQSRLDPRRVRFARTVDLPALLSLTTVVLFPVDDLWGKVDLPIALLEAMRLGVPIVTLDQGPLTDLKGVLRVPVADHEALARAAIEVIQNGALRVRLVEEARRAVARYFDAPLVAASYERLYESLLAR